MFDRAKKFANHIGLPATKTDIAKTGAQIAVSATVTEATTHVVDEYTEFDSDSIAVETGSLMLGYYVSLKLRPVTDAAIDRTVNAVKTRREIRRIKKQTSTATTIPVPTQN